MSVFPVKLDDLVDRFPEWLDDALDEYGMTQYALGRAMDKGGSKGAERGIYGYRRGNGLPKLANLARLVNVLEPRGAYIVPTTTFKMLLIAAAWAREHGWRG